MESLEDIRKVASKIGVNIVLVSATAADVVENAVVKAGDSKNTVILLNNFPSAPFSQGNFETLALRTRDTEGQPMYQTTFPPESEIATHFLLTNAPKGSS